jgi:flagellar basal body-associated protein FliL
MAAPVNPSAVSAPSAPRESRRLLMILTATALGVAVLTTGVAIWLTVFQKGKAEAVSKTPAHVFRAGTLVVNITETNGRRYLRTTLELGTASAKDGRRLEEQRTPLLDAAIGVLSARRLEELLDPAKREVLKAELKRHLNAAVDGASITQVFFTEFVIQ